jgi:hypothetical protein
MVRIRSGFLRLGCSKWYLPDGRHFRFRGIIVPGVGGGQFYLTALLFLTVAPIHVASTISEEVSH